MEMKDLITHNFEDRDNVLQTRMKKNRGKHDNSQIYFGLLSVKLPLSQIKCLNKFGINQHEYFNSVSKTLRKHV